MSLESYAIEKQNIIKELKYLDETVEKLNAKYPDIFENEYSVIKEKIHNGIKNIENKKFTIAFFGAFSDGKTTILSALTKNLDLKIAVEPTTDEIKEYVYKDYIMIDTPGLFSENLIHDEKTKKYISEANVIIYTVDAENPLKESHHDTLKWLLVDLDKAESAIFVINKMDTVTDLEDNHEFNETCTIKKSEVSKILSEKLNINANKIVCIAANPFNRELKEWLTQDYEDYKKLSRIDLLEDIIDKFIKDAKEELIIKSGYSEIKDITTRIFDKLKTAKTKINKQLPILKNQLRELQNEYNNFTKQLFNYHKYIREGILSLRDDIIFKINSCPDEECLRNILLENIGKDGYLLEEKIKEIYISKTNQINDRLKNMIDSLEISIDSTINLGDSIPFVLKDVSTLLKTVKNTHILAIRDALKLPIKFKPYGAVKLAKNLRILGTALKIAEVGVKIYNEYKFNDEKNQLINKLEEFFKNTLDNLTIEQFSSMYAESLKNMKESIEQNSEIIKELENKINEINALEHRIIEKALPDKSYK